MKRRELQTSSESYVKSTIPFMKLGEGKHRLRFLPKGNKEENLPFKAVQAHTLMISAQGGKKFAQYILCYDWLFTHEGAVEATIKPLIKMKKLLPSDIEAFKNSGGCPICRAMDTLKTGGESKETFLTCRPRTMSYWNVLNRADKKIYVASLSETKHREICSAIASGLDIDEETGKPGEDAQDILDLETGFDFQCIATGQMLGRRYTYTVIAKSKPVTAEDIAEGEKPLNLMLAVAETFKSFGEMCAALREVHGTLLASYGFKYGVALKDTTSTIPDLDLEDEDKPKTKKKSSTIDWDEDDEQDEAEDESKPSNHLKSKQKINPLTGNKLEPAPWDEDEDDEEEDEVPVKKTPVSGVKKPTKAAQKTVPIELDDDDEEVEIENGKLVVGGVKLF